MNIKTLKENQIFVFGSNMAGKHLGGSARQAVESFGAIENQGQGLQGQSYAIATLDENFKKVSLSFIQQQLYTLSEEAKQNPDKEYLLTPIGTGIAGFTLEEIKEILPKESLAKNIKLVGDWN
ncbi:hypothetical protein K9M47_03215 [Candidatus Gracilibacteria bacterium]|nr:hypothetical protein [Candidatus Gracilibacteria bacterium]